MAETKPTLEDRAALEDALLAYLTAVDKLSDLDGMMRCFTEDAVLDLSGLQLKTYHGHDEIRGFYAQVFETMSHHMHMMSNFRVIDFNGDNAHCYAYVCGMGRSVSGVDIQVYVYYDLHMRRVAGEWKIGHFYEAPQLPMPSSVTAVHAPA